MGARAANVPTPVPSRGASSSMRWLIAVDEIGDASAKASSRLLPCSAGWLAAMTIAMPIDGTGRAVVPHNRSPNQRMTNTQARVATPQPVATNIPLLLSKQTAAIQIASAIPEGANLRISRLELAIKWPAL